MNPPRKNDQRSSEAEEALHLADERRLKLVIRRSMVLCLGAMAAFIASIRQVNPELEFRFDWRTLLAMLFGGWMGQMFWRVIPREGAVQHRRLSQWLPLALWLGVLTAGMLFGFAYGMKDISGPKQQEMVIGTAIAILVIALFSFLIWRIGRFFEDDHKHYLEQHPEYRDHDP